MSHSSHLLFWYTYTFLINIISSVKRHSCPIYQFHYLSSFPQSHAVQAALLLWTLLNKTSFIIPIVGLHSNPDGVMVFLNNGAQILPKVLSVSKRRTESIDLFYPGCEGSLKVTDNKLKIDWKAIYTTHILIKYRRFESVLISSIRIFEASLWIILCHVIPYIECNFAHVFILFDYNIVQLHWRFQYLIFSSVRIHFNALHLVLTFVKILTTCSRVQSGV